ncbi:MAG TPA: AI-2E family transporter [Steroidobacteraceae bacterium]|nr:AI-2E family transporter [Steroidobacteraceae bacterium]
MLSPEHQYPGSPRPPLSSQSGRWARAAAKTFIFLVIGVLLYIAHTAFVPVALALLMGLVLSGPVEGLHKHHVPRSVSAALILVVTLTLIGGTVSLLWTPAQTWFAKGPQTISLFQHKARPLTRFIGHLDELRNKASNLAPPSKSSAAPVVAVAAPSGPSVMLDASGSIIAALLTFVIVTLFLLTGGPPMLARMTAAFVDDLDASHVQMLIEKVRVELGRFYLTTTCINIGLGAVTGLAMWAWKMPNPFLWGALAALLNYIPYAGAITTVSVLTVVAVVTFNTLGQIVGVGATYVLIATFEGQVAQPLLVGRRLEVNPLLIFLALWFGGLFWGVAGIVLATPTLVALKVLAENSKSGRPMMVFLGPNHQAPGRDAKLYRLVRKVDP